MVLKYLLDEHINPTYRAQLVRRNPELVVRIVGDLDAPCKGTLDPDILLWCEANDFILVTNNRKSMPRHLTDHLALGCHVPGIFVLNLDQSMGQTIEELLVVAGASFEDEYRDRIEYLPLT